MKRKHDDLCCDTHIPHNTISVVLDYLEFSDAIRCTGVNKIWKEICCNRPIKLNLTGCFYNKFNIDSCRSLNGFKPEGGIVSIELPCGHDDSALAMCSSLLEHINTETVEISVNLDKSNVREVENMYDFSITNLHKSIKCLKLKNLALRQRFWRALSKQSVEALSIDDCYYDNSEKLTIPSLQNYEVKSRFDIVKSGMRYAFAFPPVVGCIKKLKLHVACWSSSFWQRYDGVLPFNFDAITSVEELDYYNGFDFSAKCEDSFLLELLTNLKPKSLITACCFKDFKVLENKGIEKLTLVTRSTSIAYTSGLSALKRLKVLCLKIVDTENEFSYFNSTNTNTKVCCDSVDTVLRLPLNLKTIIMTDAFLMLPAREWLNFVSNVPNHIKVFYNGKYYGRDSWLSYVIHTPSNN